MCVISGFNNEIAGINGISENFVISGRSKDNGSSGLCEINGITVKVARFTDPVELARLMKSAEFALL